MVPYSSESWIDATWLTADELSGKYYISETVTDIPANRTWGIADKDGKITYEEREEFLVYGKQRICHAEYREIEAGEWVFTKSTSSE